MSVPDPEKLVGVPELFVGTVCASFDSIIVNASTPAFKPAIVIISLAKILPDPEPSRIWTSILSGILSKEDWGVYA